MNKMSLPPVELPEKFGVELETDWMRENHKVPEFGQHERPRSYSWSNVGLLFVGQGSQESLFSIKA